MRIVIWNCNMAFDQKFKTLLGLKPDIAIVPESAEGGILARKAPDFSPMTSHWHGGNVNKGLSVFTFGEYSATLAESFVSDLHWVLPLRVKGPIQFNLLAVWAKHPSADKGRMTYRGPVLCSIDTYADFLSERHAVVAGDFNNNVIWDKPGKAINHANTVRTLRDRHKMASAYHVAHNCNQGREIHPTLFWQRSADKTYHVDHCFVPEVWLERGMNVTVGAASDWLTLSDHAPMVIDV